MKVLRTTILLFLGSVCNIPAAPGEETPISLEAAKDQGRNTSRFLKEMLQKTHMKTEERWHREERTC
jgi:hypothetical protein